MSDGIIVYGKPTCPMVGPVKRVLESAQADFEYIDIFVDREAKARVTEINHGNESVPTLVFSDGSTLTEPSIDELKAKLNRLGYAFPTPTAGQRLRGILDHPLARVAGFVLLAGGVLSGNAVLTTGLIVLGVLFLGLTVLVSRLS